jgi:5-(carboxyamino)imidazole ribonucleotide mutase
MYMGVWNTVIRHNAVARGHKIMKKLKKTASAQVGIIMGSKSDWPTMQHAAETLQLLEVSFEARVLSAHRIPDDMIAYGKQAANRGIQVIIAGAGGSAHLPGMLSAVTTLPVLGVPIQSSALQGLDSLLSIVQMPGGVPVGTLAIGKAGAINAALLAVAILGLSNVALAKRYRAYRDSIAKKVRAETLTDVPAAP